MKNKTNRKKESESDDSEDEKSSEDDSEDSDDEKLCLNCKKEKCWFDDKKNYLTDFCGKTCAKKYIDNNPNYSKNNTKNKKGGGVGKTVKLKNTGKNICKNCNHRNCWVDSKGFETPFCGKSCASQYFLNKKNNVNAKAPILKHYPSTKKKFIELQNQFLSKWMNTQKPTVINIFKIYVDSNYQKRFENYQNSKKNIKPYKNGKLKLKN
jgi:hypothetical protein